MLDKTYFSILNKSEYVFSILNTSISKEIKRRSSQKQREGSGRINRTLMIAFGLREFAKQCELNFSIYSIQKIYTIRRYEVQGPLKVGNLVERLFLD